MKKLFLMAAVVMLSAVASFAQIGARIGMNFANWANKPVDSRIGAHLGVVYNIELGDSPLSLQPGFFFSQRNFKDDNTGNWKANTSHLELPILIKYNLEVANDIVIDPHVGPYFAMALAGHIKDSDPKIKIYKEKDGHWGYENMDMGITTGCGATFFGSVYAGIDYSWGLNEIGKTQKGDPVRNHNFSITFGVWFGN